MMHGLMIETPRVRPGGSVRAVLIEPGFGRFTGEARWETSGKGDTDAQVVARVALVGQGQDLSFELAVPLLPLSYTGTLVKIGWFVRVHGGSFDYAVPFEVAW